MAATGVVLSEPVVPVLSEPVVPVLSEPVVPVLSEPVVPVLSELSCSSVCVWSGSQLVVGD